MKKKRKIDEHAWDSREEKLVALKEAALSFIFITMRRSRDRATRKREMLSIKTKQSQLKWKITPTSGYLIEVLDMTTPTMRWCCYWEKLMSSYLTYSIVISHSKYFSDGISLRVVNQRDKKRCFGSRVSETAWRSKKIYWTFPQKK